MISIIMPAYNAEQYIESAIQSVRKQTVTDWELIVVDDLSSDNTAKIVSEIMREDARIHLICNEQNQGVSYCRNMGVQKANGEWIAFLDSDDCWKTEKLEHQLAVAEEKDAQFIFTGSAFMDEDGQEKDYILQVKDITSYKELLKQNIISCSSVMIKKDLMLQYPMGESKGVHEDYETWLRILRKTGCTAYAVNEPLLIYRLRKNSKSGNKMKSALMHFRVYRMIGLSLIASLIYFGFYIFRGLKKYKNLV